MFICPSIKAEDLKVVVGKFCANWCDADNGLRCDDLQPESKDNGDDASVADAPLF